MKTFFKKINSNKEEKLESNKSNYNSIAKILLNRLIPAMSLITFLVIVKHYVVQHYIVSIDNILQGYDINAVYQLELLEKTETLTYYIILVLIVFLCAFVFLPTFKKLSKSFHEVKESNENIMKLFKAVHGALFLLDMGNHNILLMNNEAEKLINTEFKEGINIKSYLKIKTGDFYDIFATINECEHNEEMEIELILKENQKMYVIVTTTKIRFNNKDSLLMGLFDISKQKQCEEVYKDMAIKDNLTELYNRNYFEQYVKDKIEEAEKYDEPISMLMIDIDYFKIINDTYGHPIGDEVLKFVAKKLKSVIRKSDDVFRVGGEEFVVLMPKSDVYAADIVAEKIRVALENSEHPVAGKITVSIGVAQRLKSETSDDWYKRVDKALYCAKEGGRNCVVNYDENNNFAIARIEWKKNWESGNKTIDNEHMKLIELGNSLIFMDLSNYDFDKVLNQLDKLINHIVNHFKDEESILNEINYVNYDEHKKIHNDLLAKASSLKEKYLNGNINKTAFFSFIVDDIVKEHMEKEDVKFYDYLKNSSSEATS